MIQFITVEYARLNGGSDLLILGRWRFPSIFCNQAVRLNKKPISRASSAKTSVNTDTMCFSQNHSSLRNNSGERRCLVSLKTTAQAQSVNVHLTTKGACFI